MSNKLSKRTQGFTIIEVLIVLAIASLILLAVFLAVPALQRNSHNTSRKQDVAAALGAITEFESNNNGAVPTVSCAVTGQAGNYTMSTGTCAAQTGTAANFKMAFYTSAPTVQTGAFTPASPVADVMTIVTGNKCDTTTAGKTTATGAGPRSFAASYAIESGSTLAAVCQES
jgi:prepilin-type N-terminal cleavage/methylation domain-containing protein